MKHIKTQQELNEASENLNISDVSDSELFTLQDIKDAVTIAFRWGKPIEWGEKPEKYDEEDIQYEKVKYLR